VQLARFGAQLHQLSCARTSRGFPLPPRHRIPRITTAARRRRGRPRQLPASSVYWTP